MNRLLGMVVISLWLASVGALVVHDMWPRWTAEPPPGVEAAPRDVQMGIFDAHGGRIGAAWNSVQSSEESLSVVAGHVTQMQDALSRQIMVENPSTYLRFVHSTIPEPEFLVELARRTGCLLLLDINNVVVSAHNHDFDPRHWLLSIPGALVGEIHLAGHACIDAAGRRILIDDHGSRVCDAVWTLYAETIDRIGWRPTLIEWDTDVPPLPVLLAEAQAAAMIQRVPVHARAG